ncbi:flagellar hook-length control protein FliK [Halomonas sp. M4R5S39]|uniref:flagellar hook-length control protein FliK n=1 Tax=Halomonas kalidii TaxID=3043293 RepID=UPI0024A7C67F|nr:flagellar hook-length control protein FliK [Halomonas kalidii]MDI5987300.1 flagellar hook-length control protein FliK [Halomonas kalidii]
MDIQLLLASTPGQGSAAAGTPRPGAPAGFSLALAQAGRSAAPGTAPGDHPAGTGQRLPLELAAGLTRGSREVMMQALGEGEPVEGGDARLAEIAERLALIEGAGRADTPVPADAPTGLALDAEALAARIDTTEVAPEALPGDLPDEPLPDAEAWPALAMAGQVPPGASGRDAQAPAVNAGRARPVGIELAASGTPADRGAPSPLDTLRAAGEARPAAQPAEPLPAALPTAPATRGDTPPAAVDARGEGFAALLQGQPAGATSVATPTATQATLPAPLASPAWPQQFTQQVGQQLVMLGQRGGEQRIELHLNPAELGPLTVSLKVSEQAAQAQFLSAHAPVRSAVEQAIPQLREALAEQGISLGEASVGEQPRDEAPRDFAGRGSAGGGVAGEPGDELDGHGASATTAAADIALDGRVDLYA